jgi:hypothetical protein
LLLRQKISLVPIKARPAVPTPTPTREFFLEPGHVPFVRPGRSPVLPRLGWGFVMLLPRPSVLWIVAKFLPVPPDPFRPPSFSSTSRGLALDRLGPDSVGRTCTWTFAVSNRHRGGMNGGFKCLLAEPHVHEPHQTAYWSKGIPGFADPPAHGYGQQWPSYIARDNTTRACY